MNAISNPSLLWYTQFRPYVNDERVRWDDLDLIFVGGVCELKLEYEHSFLIGALDAFIVLEYQPGKEGQGLVFDPPLGQLVEMAEGTASLSWTIKADEAACGSFVLQFVLPKIVEISKSPPVKFEMSSLEQELEVKFDKFSVSFGASAYPCHGAEHTFTVLPKPGSRLLNKNIKLLMGGENLGVVVSPSLENEQLLTPEGATWELNCLNTTKNGAFSLQLMSVKSGGRSSPIAMSLGHNLVRAEHWRSGPHWQFPDDEYYMMNIRATSQFLNTAASSVEVTIMSPTPTYVKTNALGEFSTRNIIYDLRITNRYDGTVV